MLATATSNIDTAGVRYIILAAVFMLVPYFLLTYVVMPQLQALQEFYRNADSLAAKVVE